MGSTKVWHIKQFHIGNNEIKDKDRHNCEMVKEYTSTKSNFSVGHLTKGAQKKSPIN